MNPRALLRTAAAMTLAALLFPLPGCAQDRPEGAPAAERDRREDPASAADAARSADPATALRTGDYEAAAEGYRALVLLGRELPGSVIGYARARAATGRYAEALDILDGAVSSGAVAASDVARTRGDLLRVTGSDEAAEAAYRGAIDAGAPDAALARLGLAELLWERGGREEAEALFTSLVDAYGRSSGMTAEELAAVGTALTYLGAGTPELFHDAVRAFEEAIDADPGDPRPRVELARLFLEKFDSRSAGELLREALDLNPRHAPALLAMGRRARFDGSSESFEHVLAALDVNPRHAAAHAFLAELHLELEEVERAETAARTALETNPNFLPAWTALAAAAHLRSDTAAFAEARDRVLSLDPGHAPLFETLAEVAYRTRRYGDAVRFARRAVEHDARSWTALASLGMNQLRAGDIEAGRRTLESAFRGDPFNLWVKNTLDLLDVLETFDTAESRRFVFRLHPDEAAVLSIYAPMLAEEAFAAMERRYGYAPPTPVSVEIYDRHADFSVRTVGLAGLGALGVSFGSVLAMDSPGARPTGEFNWGSTLWHEISHAFTLGYTGHRIPRWFSEGLAVLDERRARPGWGHEADPGFLVALREGRLPGLDRFDLGFVRPAYRGQVQHSYLLASLLCEWIEERHGIEAIRAMLDGYRRGDDTPAVFEAVLGAGVPEVEDELHAWIRARYASALSALEGVTAAAPAPDGSFPGLLRQAEDARAGGRQAEAVALLERARAQFPEYAGPGAPALQLAKIHARSGDTTAALAAYRDYVGRNENDLEARLELARLERAAGDAGGELRTLESALWIEPFAVEVHARLAEALEAGGDWEAAAVERRALLALEPTDMAAAWFHLARALHRSGSDGEARTAVLRALEIAPSYDEALELLLEIRGEGGG